MTPSACIEEFFPYIFLLILVEVLKDALQPNFQQVEDGRLRALVQDLPAVLLKSKADSTARKYESRGSVPLSYTRAREIVLSAFDSIGLPKQDYGLHSLRAGGASAAANARVPDRLFKRHGRWKSDKAKDGYIKDSVHSLLSVSLPLGI